ncbi:MAG: phosphoglycerol transferase MdoB-like AlkP superfamily enzyme [Crocinitomicaceae bacterium]|jgi:phosphoglycerol transferase MdoB-like AlkP superfamily enzyme
MLKHTGLQALKMILFWILIFDFERLLFSIEHWGKLEAVSWADWFLTFIYSFRLDLSTIAYLSILPLIILAVQLVYNGKWVRRVFIGTLFTEVVILALVHSGEINAYAEWNHKLTSRVFMHLSNPDEVFRTADYSMTVWFTIYALLEIVFGWRMLRWLFKKKEVEQTMKVWVRIPVALVSLAVVAGGFFVMMRGGLQQIPINISSAYYSKSHVANDLSVNSVYYFAHSYILYNDSDIEKYLPKINIAEANATVTEWFDYPKEHDTKILNEERPNVVFIILESWSAEAIGCLSETKGATPGFDAMAKDGMLFTNVYSTSSTSEIGNSSIFSGNPGLPGISISLQPEKHRKLRALNQDFEDWGYSSHYVFSGDLKYGNIGSYFMDHGFQDVIDENDFPSGMNRGKLNYFDEDLYDLLIQRINKTKGKFMHCAFTGSTHSPYDHPKKANQTWKGEEAQFMNSVIYADGCLSDFIKKCKKQKWFDNTIFVFIADHGHSTPSAPVPYSSAFYRIPILIWGEPLKDEYRGQRIDKLGSQTDVAATLMYQFGGDLSRYPWSKDLLNPESPEFALHTIIDGYGWVSPKGAFTYKMMTKQVIENSYSDEDFKGEVDNCNAYLRTVYEDYKAL